VAEALTLFGSCLLVLLAMAAAWNSPPPQPFPQARSWLFGLRVIAASLGLGVWLPAFAAESRALGRDATWVLGPGKGHSRTGALSAPLGVEAMRAGYPWLTAACLLSAAWSLATVAALWRGLSPEAWLIAAWLLGGIYMIAAWGVPPGSHAAGRWFSDSLWCGPEHPTGLADAVSSVLGLIWSCCGLITGSERL
jgi:hypothetical protein